MLSYIKKSEKELSDTSYLEESSSIMKYGLKWIKTGRDISQKSLCFSSLHDEKKKELSVVVIINSHVYNTIHLLRRVEKK